MGQIAPDALRCNCDVWGGWGWGRFRSLLQKVIKGQGERKENILHELLTTAMLSASGSALQSLCKESKGPGCDGQLTLEQREVMLRCQFGERISI